MTDVPNGAILQRDERTLAIVPRTPAGLVTPEHLEAIARIARKYNLPQLKITSGQRIALIGIEPEDHARLVADLQLEIGEALQPCVHYVQTCPGTQWCTFGLQDSIKVGLALEKRLAGRPAPAKVKLGVSGCNACCAESYVRDIGLIASKRGWIVAFGGSSGSKPRAADVIARHVDEETAMTLTEKLLDIYIEHGQELKRTWKFVDKVGIDWVKKQLG
ncbi:MAG: NAD(P)/FAD-dependent oxidoreductase [Deltaproteobacteria bacterium]|jgi:NAD(P)H-nitrite reductase large subunit|nr:NAD(P)/FAD-dependent oxidoreductase [Deltaproteobacteria bacterium]MBW2531756.1 NAD(P)/FAD-dependent oxidoreductase [Deltaproteobacteria bacterium]